MWVICGGQKKKKKKKKNSKFMRNPGPKDGAPKGKTGSSSGAKETEKNPEIGDRGKKEEDGAGKSRNRKKVGLKNNLGGGRCRLGL